MSMSVKGLRLVLLTAALVLGAAVPAQAVLVQAGGQTYGVAPQAGVQLASGPVVAQRRPARNLASHGGPVMHSRNVHLVLWDPAGEIPAANRALYARYFTDRAADAARAGNARIANTLAPLSQYTDGSGRAAPDMTFAGTIDDTQPYPVSGCATGTPCLTDAQIQAELTRLRTASGLPADLSNLYLVVVPSSTSVCLTASGTTCSVGAFCGYHSSIGSGGSATLYGVAPERLNKVLDLKRCQQDGQAVVQTPNGVSADVVLSTLSREEAALATNPLGDGWYTTADGKEAGDRCAAVSENGRAFEPRLGVAPPVGGAVLVGNALTGTLENQRINGNPYYLQSQWSNATSSCSHAEWFLTRMDLTPGSLVHVGQSVRFDGRRSLSTLGLVRTDWSFGDGGTAADVRVVNHAFAAPGVYPVAMTLTDRGANQITFTRPIRVRP